MFVDAVLPIFVVFALLGGSLYLLRRYGVSGRHSGEIRVVDRVAIDAKNSLILVEVDGRRVLLGSGTAGLTNLVDSTSVGLDGEVTALPQQASSAARGGPP